MLPTRPTLPLPLPLAVPQVILHQILQLIPRLSLGPLLRLRPRLRLQRRHLLTWTPNFDRRPASEPVQVFQQ